MASSSWIKILGGIFLIIGTSIGGAMFALPVANAQVGFPVAAVLLCICWLAMTLSALLILEVNLALPPGSNMVSMAKATLGKPGLLLAWTSYLFLLYCLLVGYIAGGSGVLQHVLALLGVDLPRSLDIVLFVGLFGTIVFLGIRSVDRVNIGLMSFKIAIYTALVVLVSPHVQSPLLTEWDFKWQFAPIMVLVTSFGYAIIIPSLRSYFADDIQALRKVVLIGSFIPLLTYLLWDAVIMGVVPHFGQESLSSIAQSGDTVTQLSIAIDKRLSSTLITYLFRLFTAISMLTAFLAVSLSLVDFLADGLDINKQTRRGTWVYALTFLPPMIIVLIDPRLFLAALSYAGIFCVILLMLLPQLMAWGARYHCQLRSPYQVMGGKPLLAVSIVASCLFLAKGLIEQFG